jgi:hypothetical protein
VIIIARKNDVAQEATAQIPTKRADADTEASGGFGELERGIHVSVFGMNPFRIQKKIP